MFPVAGKISPLRPDYVQLSILVINLPRSLLQTLGSHGFRGFSL